MSLSRGQRSLHAALLPPEASSSGAGAARASDDASLPISVSCLRPGGIPGLLSLVLLCQRIRDASSPAAAAVVVFAVDGTVSVVAAAAAVTVVSAASPVAGISGDGSESPAGRAARWESMADDGGRRKRKKMNDRSLLLEQNADTAPDTVQAEGSSNEEGVDVDDEDEDGDGGKAMSDAPLFAVAAADGEPLLPDTSPEHASETLSDKPPQDDDDDDDQAVALEQWRDARHGRVDSRTADTNPRTEQATLRQFSSTTVLMVVEDVNVDREDGLPTSLRVILPVDASEFDCVP